LAQHNTEVENARLLMLANVAMADAGIACWDSKYAYDLWRPVAAIRRADEDGNPLTQADPNWTPLGAPGDGPGGTIPDFTPPFPAYTSGHATFGAAVFKILAQFYGTDRTHFTLHSDELPGVSRSFDRFSDAAAENGISRIYLGIHWNFDNLQGQKMGRSVADYVFDHVGEPLRHRPPDRFDGGFHFLDFSTNDHARDFTIGDFHVINLIQAGSDTAGNTNGDLVMLVA
jgi:hypothetical protein